MRGIRTQASEVFHRNAGLRHRPAPKLRGHGLRQEKCVSGSILRLRDKVWLKCRSTCSDPTRTTVVPHTVPGRYVVWVRR